MIKKTKPFMNQLNSWLTGLDRGGHTAVEYDRPAAPAGS